MRRVILKLSGEALSESGSSINVSKVNQIAQEIKKLYDLHVCSIGIVCGGGNMWRGRDAINNGMDRTTADYMGMLGTIINCMALQSCLEKLGLPTRVLTSLSIPQVAEPYIRRKADSHLSNDIICIFGGGTGNPYFSTDTTAALRASELNCDTILMAKNGTDGVYDKDPRKYSDALKYEKISHQEVIQKKLGVMDLTAATLCMENDIDILVFDMNKEDNIMKSISNPEIGTLVTNK